MYVQREAAAAYAATALLTDFASQTLDQKIYRN